MSSHVRRLQANTRERILSTDFNNATALHHRALIEGLRLLAQGDTAVYGVLAGLTVSTTGGVLTVNVAPGLALRLGAAATTYDANAQWVELRSQGTVDLTALVDGGNPRWVVIEIAEASAVETSENRDVFDPATGTFTTSLLTKVTGSSPTLTARAGTAAATPVFPSGTAGVIPLAYVYLAAGAVSIDTTDIVHCRPMLRGDVGGDQGAPQRDVYGGGVAVGTAGLGVVLRNAGGRFANHRVRWGISALDGTTAYTLAAAGMDGAALPGADDVIYFYACPPPYPSGYDANLAPREHRPGATARTRYQGMVAADVYNAVIVASTVEPQVTTPQGNPTAGNFTMTCAPFAAAATIDRSTAVYLGAASWDFSGTDLLVQAVSHHMVIPGDGTNIDVASAGTGTYSLWNSASGSGDFLMPITAHHVWCQIELRDNDTSAGSGLTVEISDDCAEQDWRFTLTAAAVAGSFEQREQIMFTVAASGEIDVNTVTIGAGDQVSIWGLAYRDAILAAR